MVRPVELSYREHSPLVPSAQFWHAGCRAKGLHVLRRPLGLVKWALAMQWGEHMVNGAQMRIRPAVWCGVASRHAAPILATQYTIGGVAADAILHAQVQPHTELAGVQLPGVH